MAEIRVHWDSQAGDVLIIEPNGAPVIGTASVEIIPRAATTPAEALLRLRCLAPREFIWVNAAGDPLLTPSGNQKRVFRDTGFEWDCFGQFKTASGQPVPKWLVAYISPDRRSWLVTRGVYLADWP